MRSLPKVDECIHTLLDLEGVQAPISIVKNMVQQVIDLERQRLVNGHEPGLPATEKEWVRRFKKAIAQEMEPNLKRIINGTGVVIHTNLGRSILAKDTTDALVQAGGYYSNLEFNLATGSRGSRYSLVEDIICQLTGAEAALVVNNNAAAVLIALDTLAKGHEVIVSRGQLVEIGGSFRVPDVMAKSGAFLREVGATNRTHLRDYENAITEETAMLLRVHTSNFRIIGFTKDVAAEELVSLAEKHQLVTMEDLGSGSLVDFSQFGFPKEPTVQEIVGAGVDVVTFSGDKLLGGPQAGIIVGSKNVVERIKKNPLNRALRIDKFTLASLESVLRQYFDISKALENVPTLQMLTVAEDVLKRRARRLYRRLAKKIEKECDLQLMPTISRVGGGALPEYNIPSWAVSLSPRLSKISAFERSLRGLATPIIGRIEDGRLLLDVRTIQDREITLLVELLEGFFQGENRC